MIRSPLLPGVKSHALAEFVDIFPTVVDVAGLEPLLPCNYSLRGDVAVACTDGVSLRPLWTHPEATLHATALSLYPRPNMNVKHAMGFSMVVRVDTATDAIVEVGAVTPTDQTAQLRYTEWINISARNRAGQRFTRHWEQSLGRELYNHSSSGECFACLENVNIVHHVENADLVQRLSERLRKEWGEQESFSD